MSVILAIDLGKFKSAACVYQAEDGTHACRTIRTQRSEMHDLIVGVAPAQVVIEVGPAAGWVKDLCEALGVRVQVANPNHEAWRWKNVKRKTDKDDALKLARMTAMNQLPTVHLPSPQVRQWRSLIAYRHTLVERRTAIKNSIRSILDRQGITHACGKSGWTNASVSVLRELALSLDEAGEQDLWRGQLHVELIALEQVGEQIEKVETKLEKLAETKAQVKLLRTIPGVGPRLAETVVAMLDDPHRFRNGKQVGAYAGLVPKQMESGTMKRSGGITGRGNKLLRSLLVEVSWLMLRYNGVLRSTFDRIVRGSKTRRKIAVVATARKLLVICWAMLRDGTTWREPTARPT